MQLENENLPDALLDCIRRTLVYTHDALGDPTEFKVGKAKCWLSLLKDWLPETVAEYEKSKAEEASSVSLATAISLLHPNE